MHARSRFNNAKKAVTVFTYRLFSTLAPKDANIYALRAYPDAKLLCDIERASAVITKRFPGFCVSRMPHHVSIGYSHTAPAHTITVEEAEQIKTKMLADVKRMLEASIQGPFLLSPKHLQVSVRGWLFLSASELPQPRQVSLSKLHHRFLDILECKEYKQYLGAARFFRAGFQPHLSFGKIKGKISQEQLTALSNEIIPQFPILSLTAVTFLKHQTALCTANALAPVEENKSSMGSNLFFQRKLHHHDVVNQPEFEHSVSSVPKGFIS